MPPFTAEPSPVDSPISLPIPKQPEYIRLALTAGKHVLSEKPIAENVKDAQELINWYYANIDSKKVTWSVAENFRYLASFEYAREQVQRAGKLLAFRAKRYSLVKGGKYFGKGCVQLYPGPLLRPIQKKPNGVRILPIKEAFFSMGGFMLRQV